MIYKQNKGGSMYRRTLLAAAGPFAATLGGTFGIMGRIGPAHAETPGVTASEIKIAKVSCQT